MDSRHFVTAAIKESTDYAVSRALQESQLLQKLSLEDRKLFLEEIRLCADMTLFNLFALIDGVSTHEGAFEIVHVTGDDFSETRTTVNPGNSEMLHDLLLELRAENNRNIN